MCSFPRLLWNESGCFKVFHGFLPLYKFVTARTPKNEMTTEISNHLKMYLLLQKRMIFHCHVSFRAGVNQEKHQTPTGSDSDPLKLAGPE